MNVIINVPALMRLYSSVDKIMDIHAHIQTIAQLHIPCEHKLCEDKTGCEDRSLG